MEHLLFSYGTLQLPSVQRAIFGGDVPGEPDAIAGYRLGELRITDPDVIAHSGSDVHPILEPGSESDHVDGTVFTLTDDQLTAADDYEVDDYERVEVPLASGRTAWVYSFRQ